MSHTGPRTTGVTDVMTLVKPLFLSETMIGSQAIQHRWGAQSSDNVK